MSKSKQLPYRQRRRISDQAIRETINTALRQAFDESFKRSADVNGHGYSSTVVRVFFDGVSQWVQSRQQRRGAA